MYRIRAEEFEDLSKGTQTWIQHQKESDYVLLFAENFLYYAVSRKTPKNKSPFGYNFGVIFL